MKTYHIGGLNPIRRYKTLGDALQHVQDDDTIEIHKTLKESVTVTKAVIIKGNGNKFKVEQGLIGINAKSHVVIDNLQFICGNRSNAIVSEKKLELHDVTVTQEGPVREFYPLVMLNSGSMLINGGTYSGVHTNEGSTFKANGTTFTTYYGGDIEISTKADQHHLNGHAEFDNCQLSSINLANAIVRNSSINKFVTIFSGSIINSIIAPEHSESTLKLKKEPEHGPLSTQTDNLVSLYIKGKVELINLSYNGDHDFLAIYGKDADISLKETNNTSVEMKNRLDDSALTATDSNDISYWELNRTRTAFIRSNIQSNSKQETAMQKMNKLIGLGSVKAQIQSILNNIQMNQTSNNKDFEFSYHMVFAGDPGVGKTTVAKIVAEALFEIGAIPENKCTQATVDTLIKGYVGQTADNVRKILDEALGGVLFIDEAYQLAVKDGQNTFNDEALSVIIRYMEDHRRDLVVIAAGYNKEMKDFLASNVGLARRFQWIQFEDYTPQEMADIFELMRTTNKTEYDNPELKQVIPVVFDRLTQLNMSLPDRNGRITNGGNGGLVRNVDQRIISAKNDRCISTGGENKITKHDIEKGFRAEVENTKNRAV